MRQPVQSIGPTIVPAIRLRRKRFLRVAAVCGLGLVLLLAAGLWLGTRSWFIIRMVRPELERRLGGDLTIASAHYAGDGVFDFHGVELRTPEFSGPAGELLAIDRLLVSVDLGQVLTGRIQLLDVDVHGLIVRGSESVEHPGEFSFMTLKPQWSGQDDAPMLPPQISIHDAVLELGEHLGERYHMVGRRRVTGKLVPAIDRDGWFDFNLHEIDANDRPLVNQGLVVRGQWNIKTMEHRAQIEGIALDLRTRGMCPRLVKFWWDQLGLEGRVNAAHMHWSPSESLTAEMQIQNVALTLPVDAEDVWARYRDGQAEPSTGRPRMRVNDGLIRLEEDRLVLKDLRGTVASSDADPALADVPYRVSLEVFAVPTIDWDHKQQWMQAVLDQAAFRLDLSLVDFRVSDEQSQMQRDGVPKRDQNTFGGPQVELPMLIARGLEKFQMTSWSLSTDVTISRDPSVAEAAGAVKAQPILTRGHASIRNATGRYFKFPYLLENVSAEIDFDNEELHVVDLVGHGSNGSVVRIDGVIAPPARDASVSLRIRTTNAPVDERLRAALGDEGTGKAFDALFDEGAFTARAAAGTIPTEQSIQQLRERRESLAQQIQDVNGHEDESPQAMLIHTAAHKELQRLDRMIALGPFQLRGHVDLDLRVERPHGRDQRTITTGTIVVREVGVMHEKFPYPLYVQGGTLNWTEGRIDISPDENGEGLRLATPGGGTGVVTGSIEFVRDNGKKHVRPTLTFDIKDDQPTDSLFAAIPEMESEKSKSQGEDGDEGPLAFGDPEPHQLSRVGEMLRSLGLSARLECLGRVLPDENGEIGFDFQIQISDGIAAPGQIVEEAIGQSGLYWPSGFVLRDVTGSIRVATDAVELTRITGSHDDGSVELDGHVNLRKQPADTVLHVVFSNLALQRHLLNLLPMQGLERVQAMWDRYQPRGNFDVDLTWRGDGLTTRRIGLDVEPRNVSVQIGDERVQMALVGGSLGLQSSRVLFENLKLALQAPARADGTVTLNGSYGVSEDGDDLRVEGQWSDARLDSPMIPEALRLIGAADHALRFADLHPAGRFDALFSYESATDDQPTRYEFIVLPRTVDLTINEQRIEAKIEEGSTITLLPGLAIMHDVRGSHAEGQFEITGAIRTEPRIDGDLLVTHQGPVGPIFLAVLPGGVRRAIEAINLQADPWIRISRSRVRFAQVEHPVSADRQWTASFDGLVQSQGASIQAGLEFTNIDGEFDIHAARREDGGTELHIMAAVDRMLANNRAMTNGTGAISLSGDEQAIEILDLRAESYDGIVTASGAVGVHESAPWQVDVEMANVIFADLSAGSANGDPPSDASDPRREGRMYGRVSLGGELGRPQSRRGFGTARIRNGRMANMPIALRLVQLMTLSLPLSDSLNFADIEFFIEGSQANFEKFLLEGPTIAFHSAGGDLNIDSLQMNVLFRPRGTLPLMSDIVGGVSDQLMLIQVTGPLGDPIARMVSPATVRPDGAHRMTRGEP